MVYRLSTLAWLTLAACGLITVLRERQFQLWPLMAIFAVVTLFHVLTIVSARFRMPLEPLSFVWCGWALARGIEAIATRFPVKGRSLASADHAQLLTHR